MPKPEFGNGREIVFLGRRFYIDQSVHRPRASTEFITKSGYIAYINQVGTPITVADVGVGSGVTAISCALECPRLVKVYGTDFYDDALRVAARNSNTLHTTSKVGLLQGDLFTPLLDKPIDVILANLPFASTAKLEAVKREMPKSDEPLTGIHGGETGFELYEKMFDQLRDYQYIDQVRGIWIFCSTEHTNFVKRRHTEQFDGFTLMTFRDKYKPHFSHFLLTRFNFYPSSELIPKTQ